METNTFENFADLVSHDPSFQPVMEIVEQIMGIPEETLTDSSVDVISGMMRGSITEKVRAQSIQELLNNFEEAGFTRKQAGDNIKLVIDACNDYIEELKPSENKRILLEEVFNSFYSIFNEALARYHNYAIKLPIKLDKGAIMPTYANEHAACADVYALEDTTVKAHTLGNKIRTGLHFGLPENWEIGLLPRSSIGSKTPLRLSNSRGVLDEDYRGELMVLYDNISDSDYEIKAGDRIAQMWVQPVYRFLGVETNELDETERGEGGFGSTGR